jgi:hypothetical protein
MTLLDNIKAALGSAWHVNQNTFYTNLLPATDGTAQANKVVTTDANQNITITGTLTAAAVVATGTTESTIPQQAYNAVSTAPTSNVLALTGANMTGGSMVVFLNLTAALSAGAAADLPTPAALVTAMEAAGITPQVGSTYELDVMNTSSGAYSWTITTATGWTLTGTMTVAQNTLRKCLITFTSLTAATLQSLGEYTITDGI